MAPAFRLPSPEELPAVQAFDRAVDGWLESIRNPVLDRAMHYDVELYEALKTSLISMDSTMRSNLGVGLPIDVLVVRSDVCEADLNHRIEAGEPYFHDLRSRWSAALRAAHQNIPRPPYKTEIEAKT